MEVILVAQGGNYHAKTSDGSYQLFIYFYGLRSFECCLSFCCPAGCRFAVFSLFGPIRSLFVRLIHWVINHLGQTPSAILLFILVFGGLYVLRSQKIADDLRSLVVGTSELADKGVAQNIKVLSGGEIGEIAANLNRMQRIEVPDRDASSKRIEDTPAVALLIRTRAILRTSVRLKRMRRKYIHFLQQRMMKCAVWSGSWRT